MQRGLIDDRTGERLSLFAYDVEYDHNCMFRALATYIYGCQDKHMRVREEIVIEAEKILKTPEFKKIYNQPLRIKSKRYKASEYV